MKDKYKCVIADKNLIIKKWDEEIEKHNNSLNFKKFKEESLNNLNTRIVYMGLLNGKIITECTAIISIDDLNMQNKDNLVGEKTAYLTAFRTNKEFENKGYFSKLYKFMEDDLKQKGFTTLTLGVEPSETRNIQIYFNWGFVNYIKTSFERYPNGDEILVNYYKKDLLKTSSIKFNKLIPELSVSNIDDSKKFYTELGFEIKYEREEDKFCFLELDGNQLMIEEVNNNWNVGELEYPFGRGINISMTVKNVDVLYEKAIRNKIKIFRKMQVDRYRVDDYYVEDKQFLIQDPDGYLLRFTK